MEPKVEGVSREFGRIQTNGRISIPSRFRKALGWKDGDLVIFEVYKGRLMVENQSAKWRKED